ncbi:unnamed protein product [Brachionus calyciflorus]|uniref:Helitron helicase-like domain-containing protein n=1 Tax=Brachionus calyciflorus TaxID=104777 RepID=A0A814I195_9BILA|nr:unnamed protein product [Brachionus calyciflorus]
MKFKQEKISIEEFYCGHVHSKNLIIDKCKLKYISKKWAYIIHNLLKLLNPTGIKFSLLLKSFRSIFKSNCCKNKRPCKISNCKNTMNFINNMSNHFQKLRTLKRRLYEIRSTIQTYKSHLNLLYMDSIYDICKKLKIPNSFSLKDVIVKRNNLDINNQINNQYRVIISNYNSELDSKLKMDECQICHQLFTLKNILIIKNNRDSKFNISYLKLIDKSQKIVYPLKICKDYCLEDLKKSQVPRFSKLNNMFLEDPPAMIKELNFFELMLVKLGSCFQVVTKLNILSKHRPKSELFKGVKGLSIFLPLETNNTINHVKKTLPNLDNFNIIIEKLQESKNVLWSKLIDLKKVEKALHWYKENNILYKNITIDIGRKFVETNQIIYESTLDNKNNLTVIHKENNIYFENFTIEPTVNTCRNLQDIEQYTTQDIKNIPFNDRDIDKDHKCFPNILVRGTGGMYEKRTPIVKPAMYIRWLLRQANPYFRRDIQFLFSLSHNKEINAIDQGIYAMLNTRKLKNESAKIIRDQIKNKEHDLEANLEVVLQAVRGSREFWRNISGNLETMDEKLGPATFFITLSCAEYYWNETHEFLVKLNKDLCDVDKMTINQLCSIDPVGFSMFFEKRWRTFFNKVVLYSNGPLGEVTNYFWRTEYQSRGALYIHMKVWIKNAPVYGKNSIEEIQKFIEKHISCEMPPSDSHIYDLVKKFQTHKCSSSCRRILRKNRIIINKCRYGFPKYKSSKFKFNGVQKCLKSKRSNKNSKIYELPRKNNEIFINDYNPILLYIWKGNMDIQYVAENSLVLNRYLTSYITKSDKNYTKQIWDECNKNENLYGALKSFALKSFKNREISSPEVCAKLLGYDLYNFSDQIKYLNVHRKSERKRRLKSFNFIKTLPEESNDIFFINIIDNYYPNRPDRIENISLYEFASNYICSSKSCINNESHHNCGMLKNNLGFIHFLKRPHIRKIPYINSKIEKNRELYFNQLLLLFKPWRNEDCDILENFSSYRVAFEEFILNSNNVKFLDEFLEAKKKIEAAKEIIKKYDAKILEHSESDNEYNLNSHNQHNDLEFRNDEITQENLDKKLIL